MQDLPEALRPLAAYRQFILRRGKMPINPRTLESFEKGSDWQNDPNACVDAQTAINTAALCGPDYGVGFLFTRNDPFFFVDLDKCLQPDNQWSPVALDIIGKLPGAAIEISQSGRGLHIFGTAGQVPEHACKNTALGLELYTESRFVALTGNGAMGSASFDCSASVAGVVATYFPPRTVTNPAEWTSAPSADWNGPADDNELIKKALASKSGAGAFGSRASFADLWTGNQQAMAEAFEIDGRDYDASSADAALAQHLAFWTGNDCDRMLRLIKQSGLVRDKWDRADYLHRTITRAVSLQNKFYQQKKPKPENIPVDPVKPLGNVGGPEILTGHQYLGATQQIEHFNGCIYIQDMHRVFTPSGSLLKSEQFNATYGGYVFQLDETGDKTTRKAWEAFTESQVVRYPKAESMCFRPELEPGALVEQEGRIMVNTYLPIDIPRQMGDAGPFLDHLQRVLPTERDRSILLAYMAACVQHKGVKFQWTPLLQGCEGNGKTLFTRCVAAAVGKRYTHYPKAADIDNKFNGWLLNKLFIGVEDIYVPDHRREVIETLKPMITGGDGLEIQLKGVDQITADVCANFMLNSNHKDAVKKNRTDRRFAIFYTAQQNDGDLERDGMDGDYFPRLYNWLKAEGYAIVTDYLETYAIPDELNPAGACHRAPETSSTFEALKASLGSVEQEILEAIDEGRPGFAGGWISSMALERMLQNLRMGRAIPHNKRRELLQSLGFDWHPALNNGRVNSIVSIDQGKPRLFIKADHISANLSTPAEVVKAYQDAQGGVAYTQAERAFG